MTFCSGHKGNTFGFSEGVDDVESEFGDGGTSSNFFRLLEGESMSEVCRASGISHKTRYEVFDRYKGPGLEAPSDSPRRPVCYANQLPEQVEQLIDDLKQEKPHWGARKIRRLLLRRLAGNFRVLARSTVHAVLDRHGLVVQARKRRAGHPTVCDASITGASSSSAMTDTATP